MANDKHAPKELKVTDKRIFTADGEIRDEFKDIKPAEPQVTRAAEPAAAEAAEAPAAKAAEAPRPEAATPRATTPQAAAPQAEKPQAARPRPDDRRRPAPDPERTENPSTPFALFAEQLIAQAYMSLGMLRNPYQPQAKVDVAAARQMIDILSMLQEKTQGNLTPEEEDFLTMHLGELKLAFVQRTKSI